MNINNIINDSSSNIIFNIHISNITIPITDSIIMMWIISLVIILLSLFFSYKLKIIPGKRQSMIETVIEFIQNLCEDSIGKQGKHFISFIGTMFIFLVFANIIDIINSVFFKVKIIPPTKDLSVVIALAIISIGSVIYSGIKFKGTKKWLKSFFEPIFFIFPFKLLDYLMKPISLTLRLFGNITVGFLIMAIIVAVVPIIVPGVISLYFDIFDGLLQAYIFVFLTSLYIGEVLED